MTLSLVRLAKSFTRGRRRWLRLMLLMTLVVPGVLAASAQPAVLQIDFHDTLQTERVFVFNRAIARANAEGFAAVLVNLSTPGGISSDTDDIIRTMRRSRVPIIVWAGASKTRVTGEGLRLMAEADVALMHPDTYLTPLWTEKPHGLSQEARSAGSQRLLAELNTATAEHGRSDALAEELSGGVHWFTAAEAVQAGFVDGLASKPADAMRFADGRRVRRNGQTLPLKTAGAHITMVATKPQEMLLLSLMNPDLSVLLLTLGLLLIYLEVNTPGTVVPGAAGVLLVLLAVFALHMLPLNTSGVLLCIAAVLLLLLEARYSTHGLLATAGILCLVIGLATMVDGPLPQLQVAWGTAIGAGIGFGGVTATLMVLGMESRRSKARTGSEAMLGWLAIAQTALAPEGQILVRGELWRAKLSSSDSFVAAGERVKVLRADGLTLEVAAVPLTQSA